MIIGKRLDVKIEAKLFSMVRSRLTSKIFNIGLSDDILRTIRENINAKVSQQTNIEYDYD